MQARDRAHREPGFSLMEIVLVLGITTVILAVGIPNLVRNNARQQLKGAADTFAGALRQAHTQALQDGDGVGFKETLSYNQGGSSYAVYAVRNGVMDNTPVVSGNTGYVPTDVVLQAGVALNNPPSPPSGAGGASNQENGATPGQNPTTPSGGSSQTPLTSATGVPVGAVVIAGGLPVVFGQDGSVVQIVNTPVTFNFSNGYGTFQVSINPDGNVVEQEIIPSN